MGRLVVGSLSRLLFGDSHSYAGNPLEEQHDAWLSGEAGKEILIPLPADRMKAWPIIPRVNKPENNDPEIIVAIGS